jgi:hypothetical protein
MGYVLIVMMMGITFDKNQPPTTSATTAEFNTLAACKDAGAKVSSSVTKNSKDRVDVIWWCAPQG